MTPPLAAATRELIREASSITRVHDDECVCSLCLAIVNASQALAVVDRAEAEPGRPAPVEGNPFQFYKHSGPTAGSAGAATRKDAAEEPSGSGQRTLAQPVVGSGYRCAPLCLPQLTGAEVTREWADEVTRALELLWERAR